MNKSSNPEVSTWFFDLDGCIYFGRNLADKANELLELLRERGCKVGFITNNSRESAEEIRAKLTAMGLRLDGEIIVCATETVAHYLKQLHGSLSVKVSGSLSVSEALFKQGHHLMNWSDTQVADMVIIGRDFDFDYKRLQQIANEVRRGARIISTNADYYHPGENGEFVPETGSLVAAVEAITGTAVDSVGKPYEHIFNQAMESYGVSASDCVMVGDNLLTDIAGAVGSGMRSAWIKGSHFPIPENLAFVPTWTCETMSELYDMVLNDHLEILK